MTAESPNIFALVLDKVRAANTALADEGAMPAGLDQSRVVVEPPRDPAHGDMATNAAMVLAKDAGKKPRDLAEAIAGKLRADPLIDKVDVAGPGFINMALDPAVWRSALVDAIETGQSYGSSAIGAARRGTAHGAPLCWISARHSLSPCHQETRPTGRSSIWLPSSWKE